MFALCLLGPVLFLCIPNAFVKLMCFTFMQRFAAVIMRIREPKTTALIFASGKMVRCANLYFY